MRMVGLLEDGETQEGARVKGCGTLGAESCLQSQSKRVPDVLKALLMLLSNSSVIPRGSGNCWPQSSQVCMRAAGSSQHYNQNVHKTKGCDHQYPQLKCA